MNDCSNAVIRDQLPDLVHERLDASARAAVLAHVDGCVDCQDELRLLREVRAAMSRDVPRVDVAYVVGALPKAPTRAAARPLVTTRRRVWSDWRVAAAVTLVVAGGGSFALLRSESHADSGSTTAAPIVAPATAPVATAAAPESVTAATKATAESLVAPAPTAREAVAARDDNGSSDARLGDLNESQLRALLNDIQNLKPVPTTEPEAGTLRVDVKISGEGL